MQRVVNLLFQSVTVPLLLRSMAAPMTVLTFRDRDVVWRMRWKSMQFSPASHITAIQGLLAASMVIAEFVLGYHGA